MRPAPAALGVAAAWCLPAPAPHARSLCAALGISRTAPLGAGAVALTFDDGPHPQGTPAVLELLARHGAQATFFLVGEQVQRHRALAAEIAAAGHTIALHGHRHRNLLRVPPPVLRDDLDRAHALIAETTGEAPAIYRPPYGVFSPAAIVIARRRGWEPMLWSRWGTDWRRRITPRRIARRATGGILAGDVVLLHDADHYSSPGSWRRTAAALPIVLSELERRGLRSVGL